MTNVATVPRDHQFRIGLLVYDYSGNAAADATAADSDDVKDESCNKRDWSFMLYVDVHSWRRQLNLSFTLPAFTYSRKK